MKIRVETTPNYTIDFIPPAIDLSQESMAASFAAFVETVVTGALGIPAALLGDPEIDVDSLFPVPESYQGGRYHPYTIEWFELICPAREDADPAYCPTCEMFREYLEACVEIGRYVQKRFDDYENPVEYFCRESPRKAFLKTAGKKAIKILKLIHDGFEATSLNTLHRVKMEGHCVTQYLLGKNWTRIMTEEEALERCQCPHHRRMRMERAKALGIEPQVYGFCDLAHGASISNNNHQIFVSVPEAIYRESRGENVVAIVLRPDHPDYDLCCQNTDEIRKRARERWDRDPLPDGWTRPLRKEGRTIVND